MLQKENRLNPKPTSRFFKTGNEFERDAAYPLVLGKLPCRCSDFVADGAVEKLQAVVGGGRHVG